MPARISAELDQLMNALLGEERRRVYETIGAPLPSTLRFNPLKGSPQKQRELLCEQGFQLEQVPALPGAFRVKSEPFPIGRSLSHFIGHVYIQDLSSMLPPLVLEVEPGHRVLDLCAAPGSKTSQMAALMQGRGSLVANDSSLKRLRSLAANLQRCNVANCAVLKGYGEQLGIRCFEFFDRVLLDPPCSGLGTLHKSPEILSWWSLRDTQRLARIQRSLLGSAVKALRPGGILVYATCTLTPHENEAVLAEALSRYPLELESFELPGWTVRPGLTRFQDENYGPQLARAVRLYSFETGSEGFFIARLRKTGSLPPPSRSGNHRTVEIPLLDWAHPMLRDSFRALSRHFGIPEETFQAHLYRAHRHLHVLDPQLEAVPFPSPPINLGLPVARVLRRGLELTTEGVQFFGERMSRNILEIEDLKTLERFVNREKPQPPCPGSGQVAVRYRGLTFGYGMAARGFLKSRFPKGPWPIRLLPQEKEN